MIHFEGHILSSADALEHLDKVNVKFVEINLDIINFDKTYFVSKVKDISGKSPIPTNTVVIGHSAFPNLVIMQEGTFNPEKIYLALYFYNYTEVFRTSPIKNVTKKGKKILVETENSVYELTDSK